ncbi:MAG TPA: hypothetical protein DDZ53_08955, partial [Firmicutes bacterium]|nr:hypothetical protein [Bacillota bacterium]
GPEVKAARKSLWLGALLAFVLFIAASMLAPLALFGLIPTAIILFIAALSINRRSRSGQEDYVR